MLELIVTCVLSGVFTPPSGWTVVEAFVKPPYSMGLTLNLVGCADGRGNFTACPDLEPYIKLRRTMKVGETVESPMGCKLEAISK